jgi:hypothetical protein
MCSFKIKFDESVLQNFNLIIEKSNCFEKRLIKTITGSVGGEKNTNNNVNIRLISIHFNSKLAI